MKKKNDEYFDEIISTLLSIKKEYPSYSFGRNISTAFSDYGDIWGVTDKESLFALEKYKAELELDEKNIVSDEYVNDIIADGEHLFDIQKE